MHEMTVDEYLTDNRINNCPRTLIITTRADTGVGFREMSYRDPDKIIAEVYRRPTLGTTGWWCVAVHAVQPTGHLRNWAEVHDHLTTARHALERLIDQAYRWMGEATTKGATT